MDYRKYYEAREIVSEILSKDLLGPLYEDEQIDDYPITYYMVGKLYPQQCRISIEHTSAEDVGDTEEEQNIALDNGKVPASMGISFAIAKKTKVFFVSARAASYELEKNDEDKKLLWKRKAVLFPEIEVSVLELKEKKRIEYVITEGLSLLLHMHKVYEDGSKTITATLINTNKQSTRDSRLWVNQHTFFQPEIIVKAAKGEFVDVRKKVRCNVSLEVQEMEMLYSKCRNYVTGHGCAADYKIIGEQIELKTSFLPIYELTQMMPSQDTNTQLLSMDYLSKLQQGRLIEELSKWIREYYLWINICQEKIGELNKDYQKSAEINIEKCRKTYETICDSIETLRDELVYKAFIYTNEAMYLQRKRSLEAKNIEVEPHTIRWYPFQLAFFLQEIISFANPKSEQRKNVDLLWFPTGGGKTEAYLGISAFVIFLRRLRNKDVGSGVSVVMRYTLRLLTFQQFERASAMICACELLRKKYKIPGKEISIGLWAGKALTPNSIEMAGKILEGYSDPDNESSNPRQVEKCPWCGTTLEEDSYECKHNEKRMLIKCPGNDCEFGHGLPIYLIDEEIYIYRPTFLVATVDKFAQVAHREETFSIFGNNGENMPPELIIQDELHLISGPLGTITGLYEAAFKKMCENKGVNAKVIASTATIKNAREQINSLYASDFTQFPPQGLEADDSYFAVKSNKNQKPARLYMGCMGTGTSSATIMVRVMAATLYATRYLESLGFDEDIIDSFWTITSYFNTLRELGGAIVRVVDNVQDRFGYLKETKLKEFYPIEGGQLRYDDYIELTSREKSENIGRIIQNDLQVRYTKEKKFMPKDFILSSNMISVGIDIERLNTMLVMGQPKTTAEYIQATSRVGRKTPGFVITLYNYIRSRDKSHFEQFSQYHEAFYKYVEATSVTPFAERARDRALQTLFIILCRYFIKPLTGNWNANRFRADMQGVEEIKSYILEYVSVVDPDEYENVEEELNDIIVEWEDLAKENPKLTYRKSLYQTDPALFKEDYDEDSRFRVLNSMRSVETAVQVIARE